MVRRAKPRKIGNTSKETMSAAVNAVIKEGCSMRTAAEKFDIKLTTLHRYVAKRKQNGEETNMSPNYWVNKVFSDEEESMLAEYITTCGKMAYGLSTSSVRKLAYECAMRNNKKTPPSWHVSKAAGVDWLRAFIKRRQNLSLRQPEACSLSRLTSFNYHNVSTFFKNLKTILERFPSLSDGSRIYNLDETSTTTVHHPKKIICQKGVKQVSSCTSGERGQLVTTCVIICALGSYVPPIMVFPRKYFKSHMLNGALPGTLGLANPSGWMTSELFSDVMDHFIKYTNSTRENPTLLIYDNHESHISIQVVEKARAAGVMIVTLPPHCSQKMQPLDVSVFAPFKAQYNASCESWLLRHPGIPLTIYNIAECVGEALLKSLTPTNITSGFRKTGIHPFDDAIFTEQDFLSSAVTDRTLPEDEQMGISSSNHMVSPGVEPPSTPPHNNLEVASSELSGNMKSATIRETFITPEQIRGFPKAKSRNTSRKPRRRGKSTIITDTPEKDALLEKEAMKKRNKSVKKVPMHRDLARKPGTSRKPIKSDSSDAEDDDDLYCSESSTSEFSDIEFDLNKDTVKDDFVLVQFPKNIYYVGKVLNDIDENQDYEISFLRKLKKLDGCVFLFPQVPDVSLVNKGDIKCVLPPPIQSSTQNKRLLSYFRFPVNFGSLEVR